jgi:TonB family protein
LENIKLINNDGYGAPEIQRSYNKNISIGLIISAVLHAAIVVIYLLVSYSTNTNADTFKNNPFVIRKVNITEIELPNNLDEVQINNNIENNVKPIKDPGALDIIPVTQRDAEIQTIKTQEELDKINNTVSKTGDSTGDNGTFNNNNINIVTIDNNIDNVIKDPIDDQVNNNDNKIYNEYEVEKQPECINLQNVKNSVKYPDIAREIGKEGMVSIKVLVDAEGKVVKTTNYHGDEIFFDEINEKAQNLKFTPGLQNNKPVKVWVTIPFKFKLQ